ncbi:MAG: glycosyltransferase family 4 protein, partial [Actinobacteria bacterium]|nr:glycosyltransferase family 4 protein [Actinomycetota bacterium]
MKICFVTDSFPPNIGGAEFVIGKIVEGIKNRGQNYIVITTKSWSKNNFSLELDKSKLIRIPVPGFMRRFWFQIFSIPVVIIKARDCDLIHGTSYGGILPTYIAS